MSRAPRWHPMRRVRLPERPTREPAPKDLHSPVGTTNLIPDQFIARGRDLWNMLSDFIG